MRRAKRVAGVTAILLAGLSNAGMPLAQGQAAAAERASLPGAGPRGGGNSASDAAQGTSATAADARTEKQKALAKQAEKLFEMASELKIQVDKTNKNILSMKVVEKAEAIELLAKGMKTEARR